MQSALPVKVLVVDDDAGNRQVVRAILDTCHLTLVEAETGADALRHLLEEDFAVVLLDVQLPGMSGLEVATLIRERERTRHTPIVFHSAAWKTDDAIFRGYETGAVDYILKPFVPEILRAKVLAFVELARARQSLLEEIDQRRRAEQELRAANEALEAFSFSVSHDLCAPLRYITFFSKLLPEKLAQDPAEGQRLIQRIRGTAEEMERLVQALLGFSRFGVAAMKKAAFPLEDLVRDLIQHMSPDLAGRSITWEIDPLPPVVADRDLLAQVLQNLLSNAVKYTRKKPHAHIHLWARTGDEEVVISIADNGAGFEMQYADKLFGVFKRMHRQDEFEGVGIGLANVRRIVERHGGRVWAESKVNEGATFHFTLPRHASASAAAPEATTGAEAAPKPALA